VSSVAGQNSPLGRRVIFSTAANYVGRFTGFLSGFLLTPFLVRHLGPSAYGLWILIMSVVAYGSLLDLGISNAVIKYVAEHTARKDYASTGTLVATAFKLYAILGLAGIFLAAAGSFVIPGMLRVPPSQYDEARWLVFLAGCGVSLALPCTTPMAILRGLQRFDLVTLISSSAVILSAVFSVLIVYAGGGLVALAVMNLGLILLMQIPTVWLIRRTAPALLGHLKSDSRLVRQIFSYSTAVFADQLAGRLQTKTDEIVIGAFLPVSSVTPYSIARRLAEAPLNLTDQFMKVLLPLASELHATDDRSRLRRLLLTSTRLTLAISVPFACAIGALMPSLIALWVGSAYVYATPVGMVLLIASLVNLICWPSASVMQAMFRHRPLAAASMISGIANLVLSVFLLTRIGILGVAFGTLIPTVIATFCFVLPFSFRTVGISLREAVSNVLLPGLLPALPCLALLLGVRYYFDPTSWIAVGTASAAGILLYGAVYLILPAAEPERNGFRSLAREAAAAVGVSAL
jgi:O-antigen/teichoic acid export membrane protein